MNAKRELTWLGVDWREHLLVDLNMAQLQGARRRHIALTTDPRTGLPHSLGTGQSHERTSGATPVDAGTSPLS
jgi:hypothetical protein